MTSVFSGSAEIRREHVAELEYEPEVIEIHGAAENDENLLEGFLDVLVEQLTRHSGAAIDPTSIKNLELISGAGFWNVVVELPSGTKSKYQCWVLPGETEGYDVATLARD